ncbi:uncharacterized protein LOC135226893 [Macrobrachium nipponense]|uniref:uncharacterized protein LOC135226893 n=1 Tax=Macrobrachium nipponense TaxID=159736 RepID=UPI0030C7E417
MTEHRDPTATRAHYERCGGSGHSHEAALFPTREHPFSHGPLPFSHGPDPFSLAHEMLMYDGRPRADTYTSGALAVEEGEGDTAGMRFHGARPRIRSPDLEDETNSSRGCCSEADDASSLYPSPDPPRTFAEPALPPLATTPPLDIPTALSSLMSLTTSDYFPGGSYPHAGSCTDIPPTPTSSSSSSSPPHASLSSSRMSQPFQGTPPMLLTDLPESLISPMRLSKPKRNPKTTEAQTQPHTKVSSTYSTSSHSRDSYSPTREEMERELEMKKKKCEVCGDVARSLHFGGLACDSCKAFFRRGVISGGYKDFVCCNNENCAITVANRRSCQACRFAGCLKAGMIMSLVQHDPKNSGGRQYPKGSDHPVFQQDPTSEYRESLTSTSSKPTRHTTSRISSSSGYTYDQGESYSRLYGSQSNYGNPSYSCDVDAERSEPRYSQTTGSGSLSLSRQYSSDGWEQGPKGAKNIYRTKKAHHSSISDTCEKGHSKSVASDSSSKVMRSIKGMKAHLGPQDYAEIKKLHTIYLQSFNKISIPLEDTVINESNLSVYYSYFVQSRAKFLLGIPLYKTLAAKDRKKILQIAVSMSTYIVGAQYVDLDNHVIANKDEDKEEMAGPSMPINTIRQFLTNDQFVEVMMFFSNHASLYADMTVSILMQIMGLTYPEPGLSDSVVVEAGRCHYGGLLSRYLMAVHGSTVGQQHFQTLLESQHEARKLAEMLQNLELVHQAPQRDNSSIKKILGDGIRLVCDEVREGLAKSRQEQRYPDDYSEYHSGHSADYHAEDSDVCAGAASKLKLIENTLQQLARCDDPAILAEARRILPVDLLKKFSEQLQDSTE